MREAVGVFDNPDKLDAAVAELEITAFPRPDISVLASGKEGEEKYGADPWRLKWLENNAARGISIRPEEKAIGAGVLIGCCAYVAGCAAAVATKTASGLILLAAIAGGSLAGAVIGSVIVLLIGNKLKSEISRQIRKGGLLLWVRTPDRRREKIAQDILRKHGARYVHIHSVV